MDDKSEYGHTRVQRMALTAGLKDLEKLYANHLISGPVFEKLRESIENEIGEAKRKVEKLHSLHPGFVQEEIRAAQKHLILAKKSTIQRALAEGWISFQTAEKMLAEADENLESL